MVDDKEGGWKGKEKRQLGARVLERRSRLRLGRFGSWGYHWERVSNRLREKVTMFV